MYINEHMMDCLLYTSPVGLNIKAETPAEIAISITGQMIQVRAERKAAMKMCIRDSYLPDYLNLRMPA